MSRRISARLREEAAVACAQTATWWTGERAWDASVDKCPEPTGRLAYAAMREASPRPVSLARTTEAWNRAWAERWAEAEALLRTGWSP